MFGGITGEEGGFMIFRGIGMFLVNSIALVGAAFGYYRLVKRSVPNG
jgi:hypothetical protein